ncbi:40S ribosomal protein S5-B [Mycena leptocephala]|nr:40S ribosomal protein S5-B [Mycena leptocephala]
MKGPSNGKKMLGVPIGAHVLEIIPLPTDQILIQSTGECLTDELINTAKGSSTSYVINEKDKLERVAKSNW